ncbi:FAD/NAD(P)-binding protein [Oceanicella sp. SM1341]|uniref:FAD/NAD(P)-binding protein n=1 Tax=Oceanicella sp. SM1341 TaxID=1548889 RepID=UPI0018E57063|nr:FAD-dependent oxidoreductase [Oceanicella sp. SM1341]
MPLTGQVAIIGGGFSGATVALHLARSGLAAQGWGVAVFEPRPELGRGLAYSTTEPSHRVNVSAARMSPYPDDPGSFLRWIGETGAVNDDPAVRSACGDLYPRRAVFGAYVAGELAPWLAAGAIRHVRQAVVRVSREAGRWQIAGDDGALMLADVLVIATSHPAPGLPRALAAIAGHPRLIGNGTDSAALGRIGPADRVLVVGNGLTSADVIATLDRLGHRGPVLAVSRRGLRARGHAAEPQPPYGRFTDMPPCRASEMVARVRRMIRAAEAEGIGWQAVIDAVRAQGQDIWQTFPARERRRIVRHLRPYWDVHRFRIAPQAEAVLDRALAEGRLTIRAAGLLGAGIEPGAGAPGAGAIRVTLAPRRGPGPEAVLVDAVVVTTGPAHGGILGSAPWLAGLAGAGHLCLCTTGLGLACDRLSRALGQDGAAQPDLFVAGPLARGTFGELMGLPQVSEHAEAVARGVIARLRAAPGPGAAASPRSLARHHGAAF